MSSISITNSSDKVYFNEEEEERERCVGLFLRLGESTIQIMKVMKIPCKGVIL